MGYTSRTTVNLRISPVAVIVGDPIPGIGDHQSQFVPSRNIQIQHLRSTAPGHYTAIENFASVGEHLKYYRPVRSHLIVNTHRGCKG